MAKNELLLNGEIGEPFQPYREDKKLGVAQSWVPWWLTAVADAPTWKNKTPAFGSYELDGRLTQQISSPWATHTAGLWQQVPAAAGNEYEFTIEGQAWSSEDTAPATKLEASDVNLQVGIDPTGGTDPESPLIIWSEKAQPLCQWQTLNLTAKAEAAIITIYCRSAPNLPKRQQTVFWRRAFLRPIGLHKRSVNIVGIGDTHIQVEPERPLPGQEVRVQVSSTRSHSFVELWVRRPDGAKTAVLSRGKSAEGDRSTWNYVFNADMDGLYEVRFISDKGARLLALRLVRVAREVQLVPSGSPLQNYKRIYVLLPPTADLPWLLAAAKGSFDGRFTIGFSADDAGMGDFENRLVLAINPHHWPEVLTASWFQQHYPGTQFTAVVANSPVDLQAWLRSWSDVR